MAMGMGFRFLHGYMCGVGLANLGRLEKILLGCLAWNRHCGVYSATAWWGM